MAIINPAWEKKVEHYDRTLKGNEKRLRLAKMEEKSDRKKLKRSGLWDSEAASRVAGSLVV
jgi:hypothetical protein